MYNMESEVQNIYHIIVEDIAVELSCQQIT